MYKGIFFFIKQGWKYDKRYILWRILYQIVHSLIPIVATLMSKYLVDELCGEKRLGFLIVYASILVGYTMIATMLSVFFNMDGFTRRCRVNAEFDSNLHRKLYEADFENLENPEFLDMQEKAKKFLYCDRHGFGYVLDCALDSIGHLITLIGIAAIILTLNIWIIAVFIALTWIGTLAEGHAKKSAMKLSEDIIRDQRGWSYFAGLFEDFSYGKELRLNSLGNLLLEKERRFFVAANYNLKKQNDGFIQSGTICAVLTFIQQCIAYGYLIYNAVSGQITIGAFTMYTSAVTIFASSLKNIMNALIEIQAYDMYYTDLDRYLSIPATLKHGNAPLPTEHTIEFRHVSFRYPGQSGYALKDINITIPVGQKLSVVGENGAGKTTFVKLLARIYAPSEGEILLGGVNIGELDYEKYMSLISAVFQDYKLFSFSLKENVTLSLPVDEQRVKDTLFSVGLGNKIHQLKNGIHTAVYKTFDEEGFEPSGGEGQKIALARALYKDSPIVILDEPTAALDPYAEFEIYQHFHDLVHEKTAIFISHRLSSARFSDRVAVFERGRIIEYGTHDELMDRHGKYAELFGMQAQFYI